MASIIVYHLFGAYGSCVNFFATSIYLGEGPGLLRLHSTYRHDLKIYSSDEGRVQVNGSISSCNLGLSKIQRWKTKKIKCIVSRFCFCMVSHGPYQCLGFWNPDQNRLQASSDKPAGFRKHWTFIARFDASYIPSSKGRKPAVTGTGTGSFLNSGPYQSILTNRSKSLLVM